MVSPRTTSPPTTAAPATWHSSRMPSISSVGQVTGQFGGDDQAEQQRGRHRAHGGDVGEVLRGGLAADVVRRGPVAAEVPPLQQDVGAGHDPAVGCGDHRGVVAGSEPYRRGGGEPGGELPDEPELPQLAHSALHPSYVPLRGRWPTVVLRSRAVICLGTVERYVNFCRLCTPAARHRPPQGLPAARGDAIPWRPFLPT